MLEKTINAVEARQHLGQLLEEAYYKGESTIIERAGRPMAVLVPVEQYREWQTRRMAFFAMVDDVQERLKDVDCDILEAEIAEAVAAAKADLKS